MTTTPAMPEHTIGKHDHPEPHTMCWSELELAAIKRYAESYALATLQAQPAAKCDGNHGGPRCADPECWNDDPQAQPAAEVMDADIESCALESGFCVESTGAIWAVDGCVGTRVDPGLRKFARAILALRPQAVPMTDEQRQRVFAAAEHRTLAFDNVSWRDAIVDEVEAHHGITAQGAQEGV